MLEYASTNTLTRHTHTHKRRQLNSEYTCDVAVQTTSIDCFFLHYLLGDFYAERIYDIQAHYSCNAFANTQMKRKTQLK